MKYTEPDYIKTLSPREVLELAVAVTALVERIQYEQLADTSDPLVTKAVAFVRQSAMLASNRLLFDRLVQLLPQS